MKMKTQYQKNKKTKTELKMAKNSKIIKKKWETLFPKQYLFWKRKKVKQKKCNFPIQI